MKPHYIRVWPEIKGFAPVFVSHRSQQLNPTIRGRIKDYVFDFSACISVNSSGAAALAIRLLRLLDEQSGQHTWHVRLPQCITTRERLLGLGLFNILPDHQLQDLFEEDLQVPPVLEGEPIDCSEHNLSIYSYPILSLSLKTYCTDRRESLPLFRKTLRDRFAHLDTSTDLDLQSLELLLVEMAKNSADHTTGEAFMGMDISIDKTDNTGFVEFVFGDTGPGITKQILETLPEETRRRGHFSLAEAYQYALKRGFSTSRDIRNLGIGMSIILNGSRNSGMQLSVFDAESRAVLSALEAPTHAQLRKHFYHIHRFDSFFYHGALRVHSL